MAAGFKARAEARVGQVLRGKWRLDRLLGVGGMAAVYEATHRNGKRGAVKMLHLELSMNPEATARFLREGYVANSVNHPGAVSVLDDDVCDDGAVYLVMELLEGETLAQRAASRPDGRLDAKEVLGHAEALLEILVAAHEKGVVHRDIKPDNLFITKRGEIKVLDFGIARLREMQSQGNMTRTGSTMGTPAYMAPEQALGNWHAVDGRTDLWAVGATMFELMTGRTVHVAETFQKQLLYAMTQPAPPLASILPSAPPAVAAIVDRALAFDSVNRWPDAATMLKVVREARKLPTAATAGAHDPGATLASATDPLSALQLEPRAGPGDTTAAPISSDAFATRPQGTPSARRRRSRAVAAGAAAFVAIAGVAVFVAFRGQGGDAPAPSGLAAPAIEATPNPIQVVPSGIPDEVAPAETAAPSATPSVSGAASAAASVGTGPRVPVSVRVPVRPNPSSPAPAKTTDPFNKF